MKNRDMVLRRLYAGALLAVGTSLAVAQGETREAGELGFSVTAGGSWSDNIRRVPVDEESGSIGTMGVMLQYMQDSRRVSTDIDLNANYNHYFDDEFDDDVLGGVDATLDFAFVPERFSWNFSENFGQLNSDPFAASTPENRENLNIFGTGPEFGMNFGASNDLLLKLRHVEVDYETSNLDGSRDEGELTLQHRVSGKSTLSLVAQLGKYDFDDEIANPEYELREYAVNYSVQGSRTTLSADVGYNEVILEDKADGLLVHLDATRQIGPGGKITFGVGQEFSSAGDVFQLGQAAGGVQLESSDVIGTADPFERRYLNIGYDFQRNRTSLGFEARLSRERYETFTELDRDVSSYRVYVGRQVSPVIGIRLFANLEKEEFVEQAFDDDELGYGASLDWQVGRRMSLRLQYDHYDRDSSNAASDYTEGQASLFIVWSPIQQQR